MDDNGNVDSKVSSDKHQFWIEFEIFEPFGHIVVTVTVKMGGLL